MFFIIQATRIDMLARATSIGGGGTPLPQYFFAVDQLVSDYKKYVDKKDKKGPIKIKFWIKMTKNGQKIVQLVINWPIKITFLINMTK